jgi:ATP-dependent DNA ligase
MFEFCIPTKSINVPSGPDWLHEVKYDGYRASAWSAMVIACA